MGTGVFCSLPMAKRSTVSSSALKLAVSPRLLRPQNASVRVHLRLELDPRVLARWRLSTAAYHAVT
jgi:hypothetical protein